MTPDFAAFTCDCIKWLDDRDAWPGDLFDVPYDWECEQPTPTYDETRAALFAEVVDSYDYPAPHPLAALLPVAGWVLFAGLVALLVWAVMT